MVANHNTNEHFTQTLLINPTIPVFIGPNNLLVTANVVGVQYMLILRQKALLKAHFTDAVRSCACIFWSPGKVNHTEKGQGHSKERNLR